MPDALALRIKITERLFPPDKVESVLAALASCSADAPTGEQDRIQIAVLKLFAEDPDRNLNTWVTAARVDYRDVLLWAERPSIARQRSRPEFTPSEFKALRAQDKAQFEAWLRSVV